MKKFFSLLLIAAYVSGFSQTGTSSGSFNNLNLNKKLTFAGTTVKGISTDTAMTGSIDSLATTFAVRAFIANHVSFGSGGSETDPVWTSVSGLYSATSQANLLYYPLNLNPAGYLTAATLPASGGILTETDPVWNAIKPTYRNKVQNDLLYYPLGSNPAGYLTAATAAPELDPVWLADSSTFLRKTTAAATYYPLTNPAGYLNTLPTYTPGKVLYAGPSGVPKQYANIFNFDEINGILSVGQGSPGLESGISLNAGRANLYASLNGLFVRLGVGIPGPIDSSKQFKIFNHTVQYFDMGTNVAGSGGNTYSHFMGATHTITADNLAGTGTRMVVASAAGTLSTRPITNFGTLSNFADNSAALAGGLVVGDLYRNVDIVQIVH